MVWTRLGSFDAGCDGGGASDGDGAAESSVPDPSTSVGTDASVDTEGVVWSYIWIANRTESTVGKLDTRTMVEEVRYLTCNTLGNPARTSVSVDGRAVAVATRFGGVVKIQARAWPTGRRRVETLASSRRHPMGARRPPPASYAQFTLLFSRTNPLISRQSNISYDS
jgi:hypothetical protein